MSTIIVFSLVLSRIIRNTLDLSFNMLHKPYNYKQITYNKYNNLRVGVHSIFDLPLKKFL